MTSTIKKTISSSRAVRLKKELKIIQGFWSRKAKEKGVLTEKDLSRYLGK